MNRKAAEKMKKEQVSRTQSSVVWNVFFGSNLTMIEKILRFLAILAGLVGLAAFGWYANYRIKSRIAISAYSKNDEIVKAQIHTKHELIRFYEILNKVAELRPKNVGPKTVIAIPVNESFRRIGLNLACSLKKVGVHNFFFWALDKPTEEFYTKLGYFAFHDDALFGAQHFQIYRTESYIKMMQMRPTFFKQIIGLGFDMFFLDADIVVTKNPYEYLYSEQHLAEHRIGDKVVLPDMEVQVDLRYFLDSADMKDLNSKNWAPEACGGMFLLRATAGSKWYCDTMHQWFQMANNSKLDDQQAMNMLIQDQNGCVMNDFISPKNVHSCLNASKKDKNPNSLFKTRYLDQISFVNGHLMYGKFLQLKDKFKTHPLYAFHANGVPTKETFMRLNSLWYLTKDDTCAHEAEEKKN